MAEAQIVEDTIEKPIEGTWEELQERLQTFPKEQRFQLVPLPPVQEATGPSQEEPSLAEQFAGRVGHFHFGNANLSQKSGQKFAALMAEKKRNGRL